MGGGLRVFGDDRVGVVGPELADMGDGGIHAVDQFGGTDHVEEFLPEIRGLRLGRAGDLGQIAIGAHLDPGFQQRINQQGPVLGIEPPVDQQAFHGTADPRAAGFGVQHDLQRHGGVGCGTDIDMADAFEMGKDRHARLALDKPDKPLAAAWHDHVDMVGGGQHRRHGGTVTRWHKLDRGGRQARLLQARLQAFVDRSRGMETFRPAPQDHRIARLQAKRTSVGGHIGAAFIDHTDHAQRRAHAADMQAGGHVPCGNHLAYGVVLGRDIAQAFRHGADARFGQDQAVHHRGRQALFFAIDLIFGIGVEDVHDVVADRIGGADQRGVFAF